MTAEAELIAAIVADPDDAAAYLVYADYLQSRGDPRGDLIVLLHAGDADAERDRVARLHLRAHHAALLGVLAKDTRSIKIERWRRGFIDNIRVIADNEHHA